MVCPNCKRQNSDEAVFCNDCGAKLRDQTTPRKGLKCPAGKHVMDPSWKTCPYCESAAAKPQPHPAESRDPAADLGKTQISSGGDVVAGLGKTKIMPGYEPAGSPQSSRVAGHNARIVGALISYDWNKRGDMYPITEGKNFIGAGKSTEGGLCDICISQDTEMSREHALLLFRRGEGFTLKDRTSANGTWIGGKLINEILLGPTALFRTGKTTWRFVSFELPSDKQAPAPEPVQQTADEPRRPPE